jgi:phospholipid/cholesterol/gamma-HCH transport system substrate-binding protein
VITRRVAVNLVVFVLVSAALVVYGLVDLLGNPFKSETTVSTVLPTASGLAPNFLVTLNGVDVGSVRSVSLVRGGARVTMTLDPSWHVPSDVAARVVIANALGEQEVELVPTASTDAPPLRSGAVIAAANDPTPADVGTVVAEATRLLDAIPPGDLNTLLHQLALALNGNAGNLRAIASSSALFAQEFVASQQQFEALLANAPPVLDTVSAQAPELRQSLADTATLVRVLAAHGGDLVRLLDQGAGAAQALGTFVAENRPNLACLVHDAAAINANLAGAPNLSNLGATLGTNQLFFGAVAAISPTGPAKALTSGDRARSDQEWLRTRLLLPPAQPPADAYPQPVTLPAVQPGAACATEFGAGVPAVTQAGFHPTGPDAQVRPPTAAEAHVRGGGTASDAAPAVARVPIHPSQPSLPALLAAAGTGLVAWTVTFGRRRGRVRSARTDRAGVTGGRTHRKHGIRRAP